MKFTTKETAGVTVITLEGNVLGGPDATELNNTLHKFIDAKKKKIVVDLKGVSTMNSSGLGILIGGASTLKTAGGGLVIAGASEKIRALITITRLGKVLATYPTIDDAVASFPQ